MKFYDDDLQSLQQQLSRKKHLQALLKELHTQRIELETKVASLKKIMEEDEYDVTRLERRGLASLFYGIVGKKEEKLNEERREAVTSKAKYDVAMQEMDLVQRRISRYEEELATLKDIEMKYAYALKEKVKLLKATATPVSEKILQYEEQISGFENQKKEIREAISSCASSRELCFARSEIRPPPSKSHVPHPSASSSSESTCSAMFFALLPAEIASRISFF